MRSFQRSGFALLRRAECFTLNDGAHPRCASRSGIADYKSLLAVIAQRCSIAGLSTGICPISNTIFGDQYINLNSQLRFDLVNQGQRTRSLSETA
jgi:hypothetical protein